MPDFGKALLLVLMLAFSPLVVAEFDEDYETKSWQEIEVQLPPSPVTESLIPFFVSSATDHQFYVDGSTLTVGSDGVVRFVLLVTTVGGARNVTFDGIRCETKEHRIYASGRRDGAWSKSRNNEWARINEAVANRQYAALFKEYFCPYGLIVGDVAEAKNALVRGGHPALPRR